MRAAVLLGVLALAVGCGPSIVDATTTGDATDCTTGLDCGAAGCGALYAIHCVLNDNDTYDCSCLTDGDEGETFQEAGYCEQDADGAFVNIPFDDVADHATNDCKFPLTVSAQ